MDELHLAVEVEIIDHDEEHTVQMVLDRGHRAGMTLYPRPSAPARAPWTSSNATATNASA